jgi:hypothetical protein
MFSKQVRKTQKSWIDWRSASALTKSWRRQIPKRLQRQQLLIGPVSGNCLIVAARKVLLAISEVCLFPYFCCRCVNRSRESGAFKKTYTNGFLGFTF